MAIEHQQRQHLDQHRRRDRRELQRHGFRDDVRLPVPRAVQQRDRFGNDIGRHPDRGHAHHHHLQSPKQVGGRQRVGDLHDLRHRQSRTTVQWQVSSDHAATWTNIPAATATSYTVTATAAISGYEYRAVFTSMFGTAATSPATLTIASSTPLPTITANPLSQTVAAGATASFTSSSTGATATQWQLSTNGGSTWTKIAGATSTSYSFAATAAMSGYRYRVQYTNATGSVLTSPATLTVSAASAMPVVTTNPASQSAVVGQNVSFTAAATAAATPTVQWQASFNGTTWVNISGATSTTYTLTVAATQNGYYFRAVFANSSGFVATTAAKLTVTAASAAKNVKTVAAPAGINLASTTTSAVKTSLNAATVDAVMAQL